MNLLNKKFNKLLVLERSLNSSGGKRRWKCKCDCGQITFVTTDKLISEYTKSCSCLRHNINHYRNQPDKIAAVNILYSRYKKDAEIRNKVFQLSKLEFEQLIIQNCNYCGTKPNKLIKRRTRKKEIKVYNFYYNGIDRVDNRIGYLLDNCVPCCHTCNRAKDVMSEKVFLNWIKKVYNYRKLYG